MFHFGGPTPEKALTKPLRPLVGVRVLDVSRYLPGPLLTRILAGYGAEVVKVESLRGEPMRHHPPFAGGMGAAFGALQAGKASLAVDLKQSSGCALVRELAMHADVLVESFRPGVMERLGLGPSQLCEANPRLIVASLTGYGQHGPRAQAAGHDLNYLAEAGLLSLFGPADGPPGVPGVQIADVGGGSLPAATAVMAALLERMQTGRGRHLDLSLSRGAMAFAAVAFPTHLAGAAEPRGQGMLTGGVPCYRCYRTADDRFVAVGALEPQFFAALCEGLGRPDLAPQGYARGVEGAQVAAELQAVFATATRDEWVARFEGIDACLSPVLNPVEALARGENASVHGTDGTFHVISAERGDGTAVAVGTAPALGQGGVAAARAWGVSSETIKAALAEGALLRAEEAS